MPEAAAPAYRGLRLPEAVALLHDGSTAMGLLEETGVKPGEQVLVTGAAGGMGVLLVQLARAAGRSSPISSPARSGTA